MSCGDRAFMWRRRSARRCSLCTLCRCFRCPLHSITAGKRLISTAGLIRRLSWAGSVIGSLVFYGAPLLVAFGVLALRGHLRPAKFPSGHAQRVIVLTAAGVYGVMVVLALLGFRFRLRYGAPMWPLALLAFFCLVRIEAGGVRRFLHTMLILWGVTMAVAVALALMFPAIYLRDPAPAAAAAIRSDWDSKFSVRAGLCCGRPAYRACNRPLFRQRGDRAVASRFHACPLGGPRAPAKIGRGHCRA